MRRKGSLTNSNGSAFKRVKAILIIESIADDLGLNDVTSLGHGWHPRLPEITISRQELIQWAGLTIAQYQAGYHLVRSLRRAVDILERSVHGLSAGEASDLAAFRFMLSRETIESRGLPGEEEEEAMGMTMARLKDLASFHSV